MKALLNRIYKTDPPLNPTGTLEAQHLLYLDPVILKHTITSVHA